MFSKYSNLASFFFYVKQFCKAVHYFLVGFFPIFFPLKIVFVLSDFSTSCWYSNAFIFSKKITACLKIRSVLYIDEF